MCPPTCRAPETGHRRSATPGCVEERRGPPRVRDRPLRLCPGRTPRRRPPPPRPATLQGGVVAFRLPDARPPERLEVSGPPSHGPHARLPTHRRLVSTTGARLATGVGGRTLGRAGCAPTGRQTQFRGNIASTNSLRPIGPGRTDFPIRSSSRPTHGTGKRDMPPGTARHLRGTRPPVGNASRHKK